MAITNGTGEEIMGENGVLSGGGGMSPADMAAVMRGNNNYGYCNDGWGNNGVWWIIVLFFAMMWGGNGMWGNNGFQNAIGYENLATSNEVQRGFDNQNSMANEREILAAINNNSMQGMANANQNTQYMAGMLNDKYNELQRDISNAAMLEQQAIANQNECCCSTKMLIAENAAGINANVAQARYDAALNTANLNAGMSQNRYEAALNTAGINSNIEKSRYDSALNTSAIIQAVKEEGAATRQQDMQNRMDAMQQRINDLNLQVQMAGVARIPMTATYNAGPYPFCSCGNGCCM